MSTFTRAGTIEALPDGHRLFTRQGVAYIIDDSGDTPETTDDGPLRIDKSRRLTISPAAYVEGEHFTIPLLNSDGEMTRTPSDAATLLWLSRRFEWHIEVEGERPYMVNS